MHQSTAWNVAIAKHHMTPGMLGRVFSNPADETKPVGVAVIVSIHDFHLSEVNAFTANIDVGCSLVIKPKLSFHPAFVRNLGVAYGSPLAGRIDDVLIPEIAFFY